MMDMVLLPWAGLALLWAVLARTAKADVVKEPMPQRLPVLIGYAAGFSLLLGTTGGRVDQVAFFIGFGGALVGAFFSAWSRLSLASNWSGRVTLKADHELIVTGPYRLVRHPIYAGLILTALSTALARGTLIATAGALLLTAIWIYKISGEEKMLRIKFGETYASYSRRVKQLVPGLL
jgi:protein-S-isoprenylcysteine O-methyltransferase Ste14